MANQMNKNLAKELKNFNKDELTETKTSENIVTPVTGIWFSLRKVYVILIQKSLVNFRKVLVPKSVFNS